MRKLVALLAAAACFGWALAALAADPQTFDQARFAAAQAAGKPILIDVTAPWCPICAKQAPILAELEHGPELTELVVFTIDFDTQKDLLRQFKVQEQSTLIVFHGKAEKARSTGDTDPTLLKVLLLEANTA